MVQNKINLIIFPNKTFFRPNEPVRITAIAVQGLRIRANIYYLDELIASIEVPLIDGVVTLNWNAPAESKRAYGVDAVVLDAEGRIVARNSTSFDVLEHWMQAPRYGFFSNFEAGRDDYDVTRIKLLQHHINGLQFYDWQYRWEDLLPETENFVDGMGRPQSMATVNRLIDLAHEVNAAAMPYTAIYGASWAFYQEHPDWGLYAGNGEVHRLGENLIAILDPSRGSPWNQHLLKEFRELLDKTRFDGIHIDQYGAPQTGANAAGDFVDLAQVMPEFINQSAEIVREKRGDAGVVLFNAVGNWPVQTVAPSEEDAVYIEVWPPHRDFMDLHRIILGAQVYGANKPVIIAAYIQPQWVTNWRLANAVIFASGGVHLETGEANGMLQHPYFPNFGTIDLENLELFRRYYDFQLRYENRLELDTTAANSERRRAIRIAGINTEGYYAANRVVPIMRSGETFETISLINFIGMDVTHWDEALQSRPCALENLAIELPVDRTVSRVWWASPDTENLAAQAIDYRIENGILKFSLPSLAYWSMVVVEYE